MPSTTQLSEYYIFYYEKGTRNFQGIIDETVVPKSLGVSRETMEAAKNEYKETYPGISELDFVEVMIDEDDENFYLICIARELDDVYNLRQLYNIGYIPLSNPDSYDPVPVDECIQYLENGSTKISQEDYEAYNVLSDVF